MLESKVNQEYSYLVIMKLFKKAFWKTSITYSQ